MVKFFLMWQGLNKNWWKQTEPEVLKCKWEMREEWNPCIDLKSKGCHEGRTPGHASLRSTVREAPVRSIFQQFFSFLEIFLSFFEKK